jgi:hypothetical protein
LTNKGYVDTADALRIPYTGATSNVNLGSNSIIATTAQFTAITSATPSLALGVDGSGNLRSFAVPTAVNLLPLNNNWTGTNSFTNTVTLSPAIATPSYTLGVNASNQIIKYANPAGVFTGTVSSGYVPYASSANVFANSMLYTSGTNTGIGTTSPAGRFTIYATSAADADRLTSLVVDTYRAGIRLTSNATAGCDWNCWVSTAGESPPQDALCFYNQGTSQFRMVITRDGNVGIGTTNPTGKLTVTSSTADYTNSLVVNTAWPSLTLDGTGTTGRKWSIINGASGAGIGQGNFGIYDITVNAYRLAIDSSGRVGIGVDTPNQKLHVSGDGARIQVESNTANNAVVQIKTNSNTSYLFTDQSGYLQIYPGNGGLRTNICSNGYIGLGRNSTALCTVESQTSTLTACSFFYITPGPATTFFPVVFNTYPAHDTGQNKWKVTVARTSVHQDATFKGSLMAEFMGNSSNWGNGADSFSYNIAGLHTATYNYFVGNAYIDFTSGLLVVYLRGATTYQYSMEGASLLYYPSSSPFVSYTIPLGTNTVLYATNTPTAPFNNTYLQYDSFTGLSTYTSASYGAVLSPLINRAGGGVKLSLIPTNGDPEYGFAAYQSSGNAGGATYVNAISNTPVTDYNPGTWSAKGYTLFTPTLDPGPNRCGLGIGSAGNGASGVYGDNYITSLTPGIIWTNLWISAHQTLIRYDATLVAYSYAGGWASVSDEREKENIKDLKTSRSLERILACKPKFYKRKIYEKEDGTPVSQSTKETVHIGLIAQEVLQHNPHCISQWENTQTDDEDKSRYGVNYNDYIVHLIGAAQEQQKQIEILTERSKVMEEHARSLERQLEEYKLLTEERFNKLAKMISGK